MNNANITDEQISGLRLNVDKRNELKEYTQDVLGKNYYNLTLDFFKSIWETSARYKVFMSGRCLNLMYTFYRIEHSNLLEDVSKTFYSSTALLANAKEIANTYKDFKFFPQIMIVDDILVHGKTLSTFIARFIKLVYHFLEQENIDKKRAEYDLLNCLEIRTIVQNDKPLLLDSSHYQRLVCDDKQRDIWPSYDWHKLSSVFSILTSEGYFFNNGSLISVYESDDLPNLHLEFESILSKMNFTESKWNNKYARNMFVKKINDKTGNIFGFYVVRMTQNAIDGKYIISPLIIMSDFKIQEIDNYKKIKEYIDYFDKECTKIRAESLYFLLSYNLLKLICEQANINVNNKIDIDKMSINFRREGTLEKEKWINEVINNKEPLLSINEMNKLILDATNKSTPLISIGNNNKVDNNEKLTEKLEEYLAMESIQTEKNAFLEYTKVNNYYMGMQNKSINSLLQKFIENPNREILYSSTIETFIATLIRAMDTSAISIDVDITKNNIVSCLYHPGRQSMFIYPVKCGIYLLALRKMALDNHCIEKDIYKKLNEFYADSPETCNMLKNFLEMLFSSGQLICDWSDVSLSSYLCAYESEAADTFENQQKQLTYKMTYKSGEIFKEHDRYMDKYHKPNN